MSEKINIAELLKYCPSGMELDCTMYDSVTLLNVNDREDITFPIKILREDGNYIALTKYGQYTYADFAKCVIFPKGKTTWEGFVPPCKFKDGDILFVKSIYDWLLIYKESGNDVDLYKYVSIPHNCSYNSITYDSNPICRKKEVSEIRLATEEEKARLFQAIKDNGYKWNADTKTLEKLVKPKFIIGDVIQDKDGYKVRITDVSIEDECYGYVSLTVNGIGGISFNRQDDWELVPDKFDVINFEPFMKVLARSDNSDVWECDFFSSYNPKCSNRFHCIGAWYNICIPYIGNEHLRGTTDDCDEFYKTWE